MKKFYQPDDNSRESTLEEKINDVSRMFNQFP